MIPCPAVSQARPALRTPAGRGRISEMGCSGSLAVSRVPSVWQTIQKRLRDTGADQPEPHATDGAHAGSSGGCTPPRLMAFRGFLMPTQSLQNVNKKIS